MEKILLSHHLHLNVISIMIPKQIYFAGDLFDHKHIVGNALLGQKIEQLSNGKYRVHLPQDKELIADRSTAIRDSDLQNLLSSDVAVFNFDGTDLDSGTVVEFCYAKMCDIPSVLFRSDFRIAGDQSEEGDPWNVMASGYPRTKKVCVNALNLYRESKKEKVVEQIDFFHTKLAILIIDALDDVCKIPSLFEGSKEKAKSVYQWAIKSAGGTLSTLLPETDLNNIIDRKSQNGLL